MIAYGIDPGAKQSAFLGWNGHTYNNAKLYDNDHLLDLIHDTELAGLVVGIEQIRGYGGIVGNETLDTCFFSGVLYEAISMRGGKPVMVPRKTVLTYLCGKPQAGDSELRQALIKKYGDAMKGITTSHLRSALGVADYVLSKAV